MKYPKFLEKGDTIGVTALSSGTSDVITIVKKSFNNLKKDYRLIVTPNVYGESIVSSDIDTRIKELNDILDEDIKFLFNVRGGDYLSETLDRIDYQKIVHKNIWLEGYSDITNLLYILTTKYDLATIYGLNAKSYDNDILEEYQLNNLEIMKGNLVKQISFSDRMIEATSKHIDTNGIMIGGCLDTIRYLFGTSFDNTKDFINKYQDKKIIWYFDIFSMSSIDTYMTLLQMKRMGYFKYTDTLIVGSVCYPNIQCDLDYFEAFKKVFNQNIIYNAPIGHVKPIFTIINGSMGYIKYENGVLSLEMELLNENNG